MFKCDKIEDKSYIIKRNLPFKIKFIAMPLNKRCFCGSNKTFSSCCQPFIDKQYCPQTPEQLMRSRFTAYVSGNSQYIYDTYAKSSQGSQSVKEINDWSKACVWIALQIHSINSNNKNSDSTKNESPEQYVEFSAFYITDNTLCELRENSRFVLEDIMLNSETQSDSQNLQWRYVDGDIISHIEIAKIKRKDLCPCNNYPTAWPVKKDKKFKQCCGK